MIEGCAESVDVGGGSDFDFASNLFGADVIRGAIGPAGFGFGGFLVGHRAGETEVGKLHDPVAGDHDVLGFDIAMDEVALMGVLERVGDLDGDLRRLGFLDALALLDAIVHGGTVDILHHEVVVLAGLADVVGGDDVWMIELGGGAALFVEALDELVVVGELLGEDLDRDESIEAELPGEEDGGHGPGAEPAIDLVAGDLLG